jgi:hypothetical protein
MNAVEKLLKRARRLPPGERRQLVARLERSLSRERGSARKRSLKGPYTRSLALAGTVHTFFLDVSSNKYRHVGEAVAARRACR